MNDAKHTVQHVLYKWRSGQQRLDTIAERGPWRETPQHFTRALQSTLELVAPGDHSTTRSLTDSGENQSMLLNHQKLHTLSKQLIKLCSNPDSLSLRNLRLSSSVRLSGYRTKTDGNAIIDLEDDHASSPNRRLVRGSPSLYSREKSRPTVIRGKSAARSQIGMVASSQLRTTKARDQIQVS
ncbi:uncharacterized protein LOC124179904 [Neodiprion fabricii]|uniref:uncharacterized protein LOC124179904 n=1 Tax=Neodiprion fabricii TaxID=2872261 RepID=UPI001ED94F80|nr:uncharacterized protein LOC124179904 [Neodiprion fabricii]